MRVTTILFHNVLIIFLIVHHFQHWQGNNLCAADAINSHPRRYSSSSSRQVQKQHRQRDVTQIAAKKNDELLYWRTESHRNLSPVITYGALFNIEKLFADGGGGVLFRNRSPLVVVAMLAAATAAAGAAALVTTSSLVQAEPVRRAMYFWFHAGPIVAHYKFTQWWLETTKAPVEKRHLVYQQLHNRYSGPSLKIILHLKGLYVKIGQVLSARPDFVPPQYAKLFATVQDSIPQWPIEQVHQILQESFRSELGLDCDDVLEDMDPVALGSASIGQVHRAVLREAWCTPTTTTTHNSNHNHEDDDDGTLYQYNNNDKKNNNIDYPYVGGKVVAVKVMHPMAHDRFLHDFKVFRWLCRLALPGWTPILDELQRRLMTEFDYRNEAINLKDVRYNMMQSPYHRQVRVPQPHLSLCTKHVLVMEMLNGKKLTEAMEDDLATVFGSRDEAHDFLEKRRAELLSQMDTQPQNIGAAGGVTTTTTTNRFQHLKDITHGGIGKWVRLLWLIRKTRRWVDLLVDVHGYQIFQNGCFNGDPHPGNIMVLEHGQLGLIDYGQTRRIDDSDRLALARVVDALGKEGDDGGDNNPNKEVAKAMRDAGFSTRSNCDETLRKYALLFFDSDRDSVLEGFATPQLYFASLMASDPLVHVPDPAIFVARASYMFRGMGSLLEHQIRTSKRWSKHAHAALMNDGRNNSNHVTSVETDSLSPTL